MDDKRFQSQCENARQRYEKNKAVRRNRREALREGRWQEVDERRRIIQRSFTLGKQEIFAEALADPSVNVLERIIGDDELMPAGFLYEGAAKLKTVGRIVIRSSQGSGYGTGFLVSSELLLTNNHVLPDNVTAGASTVQFNFMERGGRQMTPHQEFRFLPERFFITHEHLDFTLVAVEPVNADGDRLDHRGWNALIAESGKAVVSDNVNIIQHPNGRPQEVSLRQNAVVDVVDEFLHYETDTQPGSSGSPVYNDQWQVAALHHAGVPKRDALGNIIGWVANEGVRISKIIAHLNHELPRRSSLEQQLYGGLSKLPPDIYQLHEIGSGQATDPIRSRGPKLNASGAAEWIIPVTFSVNLGYAGSSFTQTNPLSPQNQDQATSIASPSAERLREQARTAVAHFADRPYFDEASDREDVQVYYDSVPAGIGKIKRFEHLHNLLKETHDTPRSYRSGKNKFLYPWIDLHQLEDGTRHLRSIYSGDPFDPLELLLEDLEIEHAMLGEAYFRMSDGEIETELEIRESNLKFNCEHVVPQSWFDKHEPMRGDLHHLFTCEMKCNSFRGNAPYFEFADEADREGCGRKEGQSPQEKFEPFRGKGAVARATLYFLMRYPGMIGDASRELQQQRLALLLGWHGAEPSNLYEKHRNAAIYEVQGNRNPLIDHPEWASRISFREGFG